MDQLIQSGTKLAITKVSLSTNYLAVVTNRNRLFINQKNVENPYRPAEFHEIHHFAGTNDIQFQILDVICGRSMLSVIANQELRPKYT
jgi:hypothetical protein